MQKQQQQQQQQQQQKCFKVISYLTYDLTHQTSRFISDGGGPRVSFLLYSRKLSLCFLSHVDGQTVFAEEAAWLVSLQNKRIPS